MNSEVLSFRGKREEQKRFARGLLDAALAAVDPKAAVLRQMRLDGATLWVGGQLYDLDQYEHIYVVGGGKAAAPMAQAVEEVLGQRISDGIINVKYGYTAPTRSIEVNQAGHPIPDEKGVRGVERMVELVRSATAKDLVLCLISGGGSALMVSPAEGITLADKRRITDALLRSGATINEMNAVRKHLSQFKGGGLVRLAYPAEVVSLILSDVVGNPLEVIASGPTAPDTSTFEEAYRVLESHALLDKAPKAVVERLERGREGLLPETPKPNDAVFSRTHNVIVGSNTIAARAALERAQRSGCNTLLLSTYVEGEAREVARVFAAIAKEVANSGNPVARPACLVAGGETTVTVRGDGTGGRNQELALAAAIEIDGMEDVIIVGAATDGTDGPTNASGAVADGSTVRRAREQGLKPAAFLANNDSYHFFEGLNDLIITGPTNTNVNDLIFVLVF